ncbi:hypothetical protein [Oricola sp.]|uniref:hypothetical protein n=1 Tax=Oricola sp. TaxID=1979950 RepID=UPI003BAD2C8B
MKNLAKCLTAIAAIAIFAAPATAGNFKLKNGGGQTVGGFSSGQQNRNAAKDDTYPTPGAAASACGGMGNVGMIYDPSPDGPKNRVYFCAEV